jgi:glycosyltransferase involved in cell wall biosynthesis
MTTDNELEKPYTSIIIRALNEEKHIGKLLVEIFNQKYDKPYEVIVVDSGSVDKTRDVVKKFPAKLVRIAPKDFSFGRSLNLGIKNSRGKFLVFISAHCYPTRRDWLKSITSPFEDQKIALVYGKQRGNDDTKFSEKQIFKKLYPERSRKRQKMPFCNNANAAIRRSLWEKIKYDEDLTGLEDLDWAKRAINKRFKIVYCPKAAIIHVHNEDFQQILNRHKREALALKKIYPDTNFTFFDMVRLGLLNIYNDVSKSLRSSNVKKRVFLEIINYRVAQFFGVHLGYKYEGKIGKNMKRQFYYPDNSKEEVKD